MMQSQMSRIARMMGYNVPFHINIHIATRNIGKLRHFGDITNISYEKLVMPLICRNLIFLRNFGYEISVTPTIY